MQLKHYVLGMFGTNGYLAYGEEEGRCVLVDPADAGEQLVRELKKEGLTPAAVLLTHGHYDHILAVPALQKAWPDLPVYCHPLDVPAATSEYDPDMGRSFPTVAAFANLRPLAHGQTLTEAGITFKVLHTPGHTPGSVVFLAGDVMFSGDVLFYESIGRTDFEGGNDRDMAASLRLLRDLPDDYHVLPGHDSFTVLSHEKQNNPWMRMA